MKTKFLALSLAVLSVGAAATVISCSGDDANIADAPRNPTRGGRTPGLLSADCNSTLAVDRCGDGGAELSYKSDGVLSVSNLNAEADALISNFDKGHVWKTNAQIGHISNPSLSFTAYDGTSRQSTLYTTVTAENPQVQNIKPVFYAGDGIYNVEVYSRRELVATQNNLSLDSPPVQVDRIIWIWWWELLFLIEDLFFSQQRGKAGSFTSGDQSVAGACKWVVSNYPGPSSKIRLPDGTIVEGDEIRFTEVVEGDGRYPYHSVDRIETRGNVGEYTVFSEYAGQ